MTDQVVTESNTLTSAPQATGSTPNNKPQYSGQQGNRDNRNSSFSGSRNNRNSGGQRRNSQGSGGNPRKGNRNDRKPRNEENIEMESRVLEVKRVTRVVKGGKRMRFAALVVVGDRKGQVGFGFKKGVDFQDAVAKATKKGKDNLIKITMNENGSIDFPLQYKYKSTLIFIKPANKGTGLIAGSFIRSVLELAGIENVYSKVLGSNNKISGVQAMLKALTLYKTNQK